MRWNDTTWTGWGRALSARGALARPERAAELTRLMTEAPAPVIGACRSYGDACLRDGGRAVLATRLDRVLSFDTQAGLLRAEAGVTLGRIAELTAPHGWLPAVLPGTGHATLGGAIAMDVHGKNHHATGSFGQHVTSMELIAPGGARQKLAPGSDLFRATMGGLGQTGAILEAEIRLARIGGEAMVITERRLPDWAAMVAALKASPAEYSVAWIDATATGARLGRGILEEGAPHRGLVPRPGRARSVPFDAPGFALSPGIVRGFNAAYLRRVPRSGRTLVRPLHAFFFPLDRIAGWNRLYGKRGFHQFQCVLPEGETPVLGRMLERIAASGLASPLAVLKRLGPGRAGMMSFPMAGHTLAVDLRNTDAARGLIRALEEMTAQAGGRIYLAKDALAGGEAVRAMYPERAEWAAIAASQDPEGRLATDLITRLGLRT